MRSLRPLCCRGGLSPAAVEAPIAELEAMFAKSGLEERLSKLGIGEGALLPMAEDVTVSTARLIQATRGT